MALTIVGGLTAGTNGPYLQTSGGVNIPAASLYSKSSGVHELVETSKVFIGYNNGMVSLPVCASATGTIEYPFANISTPQQSTVLKTASTGVTAAHVVSPWSSISSANVNVISYEAISNDTWTGGKVPFSTQATLYDRYWANSVDGAAKGTQLYKVKMRMTNRDWALFTFRNPIFIDLFQDGNYYLVQNIEKDILDESGLCNLTLMSFDRRYITVNTGNVIPSIPSYPDPTPPSI
jgi:hypothetical protein